MFTIKCLVQKKFILNKKTLKLQCYNYLWGVTRDNNKRITRKTEKVMPCRFYTETYMIQQKYFWRPCIPSTVNPVLRGHLWAKKKWPYKTGALLKKVEFI